MKYKSNNLELNNAIAIYTFSHGSTITKTIFNNIREQVKFFVESDEELVDYIEDSIIKFIQEKVLYSTIVSTGKLATTYGEREHIIDKNFSIKNYSRNNKNVTSKAMKDLFNKNRKMFRKEYLEFRKEYLEHKRHNILKDYDDEIGKLNMNDMINTFNETYLSKSKLLNIDLNKIVCEHSSYNNVIPQCDISKIQKNIDHNMSILETFFSKDANINIYYKQLLADYLFESKLSDRQSDYSMSKFTVDYILYINVNSSLKSRMKWKLNKKNEKRKYLVRNTLAIKIVYCLKEMLIVKPEEQIWLHQLINKNVLDIELVFERLDNPGLYVLFDYYNKKYRTNFVSNKDNYNTNINPINLLNSNALTNNKFTANKLNSSTSINKIKKQMYEGLLMYFREQNAITLSTILILFWCLNYEHLTLYQLSCRSGEGKDDKLNRIKTSSEAINRKNSQIQKIIPQIENINKNKIDIIKNKMKNITTINPKTKTRSVTNVVKRGRCPKGTRRNKKTGKCEGPGLNINAKSKSKSTTHSSVKQVIKTLPRTSKVVKRGRCPKGTRRNKKTGKCEDPGLNIKAKSKSKSTTHSSVKQVIKTLPRTSKVVKRGRCPKGTRRNKKTGKCE